MLFDRAVKIIGNVSKGPNALFHKLAPKWRFTIPSSQEPLKNRSWPSKIPNVVWQTNFSNRVTSDGATAFWLNRLLAPDCSYRFCSDDECDAFVSEHFSGRINDAYKKLKVGAAKSDLWRLLILYRFGGIYLDIDANLSGNPRHFLPEDSTELFIFDRSGLITNYFLASAPENPKLLRAINVVVDNIENAKLDSVFDMTGPTVLRQLAQECDFRPVSFRGIAMQGQTTIKRLQYIDKPNGHWGNAKSVADIVEQNS